MKRKNFNKLYIFNELITDNISHSKGLFFLHILCLVAGIILGLFFSVNISNSFFAYDYTNRYFNIIFSNSISIVSILFDRVFINLQLFLLLFIFSLHFSMIPLHYLFILYRSYILSSTIVIIITTYGVLGVVNCILLIIPQQLITLFFLTNFSICGINTALGFKRYRGFFDFKNFLGRTLCYFLISLLTVVLDIFLIFIIIRPFNLAI